MDCQEVGDLLEECLRAVAADAEPTQPTEAERLSHCSCKDAMCAELASLLQEAVDMKWPFVPEKWQYAQSVGASDKTNLSDLISKNLPPLLSFLKASIVAQEARAALAVVFLVDRFLYWTDESGRLLRLTKLLHKRHPDAPVAPQLVIRQARVYLNSGQLQKAEYILSSLIHSSGATGCWLYHSESDRALVQAVSVQVRGMILQKLGLWLEAAELIWVSLVGYYSLPQPDKKGIGTSLCILANILVSMNDEDFDAFRTNPNMGLLSLLGTVSHRLLSAAQAAKMAVVYSQYTSLYVLTNVATQGTCLLSYSFSVECPDAQRRSYLQQAAEAFAIGLLTKTGGEQVASKQELHTFLKAAYSLTVARKWLGAPREAVAEATRACREALALFCDYARAGSRDRGGLCAEVMRRVARVRRLWRVEPFLKSDEGSFIPDGYKDFEDASVNFTPPAFSRLMQRFQKYHALLCETGNRNCQGTHDSVDGHRLCISALGTTVTTLSAASPTEACKGSKGTSEGAEPPQSSLDSAAVPPPPKPDQSTTLGSADDLGSSWLNLSLSSGGGGDTGSGASEGGANARRRGCPTTGVGETKSARSLRCAEKNTEHQVHAFKAGPSSSFANPATSSSSGAGGDSGKFEVIQAEVETQVTEEDWVTDAAAVTHNGAQSTAQPIFATSPGSLSDSFSSQSSWEKFPTDLNSPARPTKAGTGRGSGSPESDGSFVLLEACDSETSAPSEPRNLETKATPEVEPAPVGPAAKAEFSQRVPNSLQTAEAADASSADKGSEPQGKTNPLCFSCLNPCTVATVAPQRQYLLSHQDYQALLAGVCHECLLRRLHSDETQFKLKEHNAVYSALHLKFSKANGLWTAWETCVHIGEPMGMQGKQRTTVRVQFLHQEERLSSYVGKDYLKPKPIQFHLKDVERQMTAQHYVTEFNKSLYDKDVMAQVFFIPSEALLILEGNGVVGCVTVEPYMLGNFVKLTNNTWQKNTSLRATEYGLAFGHFTYQLSGHQEVVVDLQGWVTANGKGLTYLTDPQIHSTKTPGGPANFAADGLRCFLEEQHGPECNGICQLLNLPPVVKQPPG